MPDQYESIRSLPLQAVLACLGIETPWRERKGGAELFGPCPVCKPRKNKANFSFTTTDGKWNCFSCNAHGRGSIDLCMAIKGLNFRDAVELLKTLDGNTIAARAVKPEIKQLQVQPAANEPFKGTYEKFFKPHPWLNERGLTAETLARYGVGYYENPTRRSIYSGSVLLKIRRYSDGECVGYLSRNTGAISAEKPKYVFPKGFQKHLEMFGAWQIKNGGQHVPLRVVYVVESPFCVMKFAQLGFPAVSPFGWSVSAEQAAILADLARGAIYLPDRNKRQESAAVVGLIGQRIWVRSPELPTGVDDPEQLTAEQIRLLTG